MGGGKFGIDPGSQAGGEEIRVGGHTLSEEGRRESKGPVCKLGVQNNFEQKPLRRRWQTSVLSSFFTTVSSHSFPRYPWSLQFMCCDTRTCILAWLYSPLPHPRSHLWLL